GKGIGPAVAGRKLCPHGADHPGSTRCERPKSARLIRLYDEQIFGFEQRPQGIRGLARVLLRAHGLEPIEHAVPFAVAALFGDPACELGRFIDRAQREASPGAHVQLGFDGKIAHIATVFFYSILTKSRACPGRSFNEKTENTLNFRSYLGIRLGRSGTKRSDSGFSCPNTEKGTGSS